jgi:hypothetical protein
VSGKLPLARRPGLSKAIEMVEAGEADQIVVACFDRLVRSLKVQLEVIERVEHAGGGGARRLPNSRVSRGYVRDQDGVLVVERTKARIVVQAFMRRDPVPRWWRSRR